MIKFEISPAHGPLSGRHFKKDPPFTSEFHEALGRLVICWASFERSLDVWHHNSIATAAKFGIVEKHLTSFSKKIEQIERVYKYLDILKDTPIRNTLSDMRECAFDRQVLMHSKFDGYSESDTPRLKLMNVRRKSGKLLIEYSSVSVSDIQEISEVIATSDYKAFMFSFQLSALMSHIRAKEKGLLPDR